MLEQQGFLRGDPFNRRMSIYFVKMVVKTNQAVVTRLKAAEGSPLLITGCTGEPAQTGDLMIDINLALGLQEGEEGYQVLKDIEGTVFKRGPVVSGLQAGANVTLSPVAGKSQVDPDGTVRGIVAVNAVLPGSEQQEGLVSLVALDNVLEDRVSDLFMLSFPAGKASSFRGKIDVPRTGVIANPQMELWFWILARVAGTLPDLGLSYRRLTRPDPACTGVALPTSDTALADLGLAACGAQAVNRYIEAVSESFPIAQGEEVFFSLSRGASDSFLGSASVLRMGFRIFAGS